MLTESSDAMNLESLQIPVSILNVRSCDANPFPSPAAIIPELAAVMATGVVSGAALRVNKPPVRIKLPSELPARNLADA